MNSEGFSDVDDIVAHIRERIQAVAHISLHIFGTLSTYLLHASGDATVNEAQSSPDQFNL
jgi:hypothetical protein